MGKYTVNKNDISNNLIVTDIYPQKITIPSDTTDPTIPVGAVFAFSKIEKLTEFEPAPGVTLTPTDPTSLALPAPVKLVKTGPNLWNAEVVTPSTEGYIPTTSVPNVPLVYNKGDGPAGYEGFTWKELPKQIGKGSSQTLIVKLTQNGAFSDYESTGWDAEVIQLADDSLWDEQTRKILLGRDAFWQIGVHGSGGVPPDTAYGTYIEKAIVKHSRYWLDELATQTPKWYDEFIVEVLPHEVPKLVGIRLYAGGPFEALVKVKRITGAYPHTRNL